MKTATLTETKNQLSALIDRVRHGETILILDRGKPVARLSSVLSEASPGPEGRLERLERSGVVRRALSTDTGDLFEEPPPEPLAGGSVLQALLDERDEGR